MNNYTTVFDKAFSSRGGRCDLSKSSHPEIYTDFISSTLKEIDFIPIQNKPSIYIDYIENYSLGACVTKHDDVYYIGIHVGTYMVLQGLFLRMLCHPDILPNIGDASNEIPKKVFNAQLVDANQMLLAFEPDELLVPQDNIRKEIQYHFIETCLKYLVMHEYAHILVGLVDYKGKISNVFSVSESESENDDENIITPLDSQSLEVDADSWATYHCMLEIYGLCRYFEDNPQLPNVYYKRFEDALYLWIFSVYSLYRLFGFNKKDLNRLSSYSHPPSGLRQNLILHRINDVCKNQFQLDDEAMIKVNKSMKQAVVDVENAFEKISEQQFDSSAFNFSQHLECIIHQNLLLKNFNRLKPLLQENARIPLD